MSLATTSYCTIWTLRREDPGPEKTLLTTLGVVWTWRLGLAEQDNVKQALHKEPMKDTTSGELKVEGSIFWDIIDKCRTKNKRSYNWPVRSGRDYNKTFLMIIKKMIKEESFPEAFNKTSLVQLHKNGSFPHLAHLRFIHMKEALAKVTEAMDVEGMKNDIPPSCRLEASPG